MQFILENSCQIPGLVDIYKRYLPDFGIFLEAGAYDGVLHSNTSCLANEGWQGIYIEPIKEYFDQCVENYKDYPNITCLNFALGDTSTYVEMQVQGEFSTAHKVDQEVMNKIPYFEVYNNGVQKCQQLTLDEILRQHGIERLDLLVLDTEGCEGDILSQCSIKPSMAIIELHEKSEEWLKHRRTIENIEKVYNYFKGYTVVYKDDINTIFVKNDIL